MNPQYSSTSSFDRRKLRPIAVICGWTLLWVALIDFAVGAVFAYPGDPKDISPSRLSLYFDYGRSMEGRLRRGTRNDPSATAPITLAGWYQPLTAVTRAPKPDSSVVTIYGMSHSVRLADALHRTSKQFSVRSVAAPGATTNWAYGAFLRDKNENRGKSVVLTIMASNLPMITSMSPMSWNTSFAMPYTSDRFFVRDGQLGRIRPPYESFDEYTRTLNNPAVWERAVASFERNDPLFDSLLFNQTMLDNSVMVRLVRRARGQKRDSALRESALNREGFDRSSESVLVANAIVADFARKARSAGLLPVIYIVNNRGYGDQVYQALLGTLTRDDIPFVSSHMIADPANPRNFLPDNHFTDANDEKMAKAVETVIVDRMARQSLDSRNSKLSR